MKQIKQYRYYGDNNNNNYPGDLTAKKLLGGTLFDGISVYQLGIQGRPNTMFYLNESSFPIVLGETGIYEIDLQDRGVITGIAFIDNDAFKKYKNGNDRLLIDIVYETSSQGGN